MHDITCRNNLMCAQKVNSIIKAIIKPTETALKALGRLTTSGTK